MKKLVRSKSDKMISGVCGGLSDYLNLDPTLVRLAFALGSVFLALVGGIIAYVM